MELKEDREETLCIHCSRETINPEGICDSCTLDLQDEQEEGLGEVIE